MPARSLLILQDIDIELARLRHAIELAQVLGLGVASEAAASARRTQVATEARIEELERERSAKAASTPPAILLAYELARKRLKTLPWVARSDGKTCPACNGALPTFFLQPVHVHTDLRSCPSCERLLAFTSDRAPTGNSAA